MIEIMIAMVITITVMLANFYLFDISRKNLARSRALTAATNLATNKLGELKSEAIADIVSGNEEVWAVDDVDHSGIRFTRNWVVSAVDLDHDGTPDMVGDIVKIRLDVGWTFASEPHHVTMATFTTGRSE